ncbi:MAG: flavodoxin family protein [Pseudomonadota bacterium]
MKIIGISCSLRKGSNTKILVENALSSAREAGAETFLLDMFGKTISPCQGCLKCSKTGQCQVKDDMQQCYPLVEEAEGIVFGTPVFFFNISGAAKIFMDRLYPLYMRGKLANKVAGVIAVANSIGHTGVWHTFITFFNAAHMLSADIVPAFAGLPGEVEKDRHAIQASKVLGKQIFDLASCRFRYPEEYTAALYQHVANKYGINQSPHRGRFQQPATIESPVDYRDTKK